MGPTGLTFRSRSRRRTATRAPNKSNATIAPAGGGVPVTFHASHDEGSRRMRTQITPRQPAGKGAAEQSEDYDKARGRDYYFDHGGETDSENFPA